MNLWYEIDEKNLKTKYVMCHQLPGFSMDTLLNTHDTKAFKE